MNYTIKTQGIMCGHCEAKVESALLAVAGVTDAEADHETNVVTVEAEGVEPEQLKAAIDMVADGTFSDGDKDTYKDLVNDWLNKDYFMTLADFRAYMDIQAQIEETYRDPMKWSRMAVLNVANSGYFSSDRSIEDYLERIWHTGPLK